MSHCAEALEASPVHLAHARILAYQRARGRGRVLERLLCQGSEVRYRQHRQTGRERKTLGHAGGEPHPGEGARPASERNRIQARQRGTRLGQQFLDQAQNEFTRGTRARGLARVHRAIQPERGRAALGRGIERDQLHAGSRCRAGPCCAAYSARRRASASGSARVSCIGGRLERNRRP